MLSVDQMDPHLLYERSSNADYAFTKASLWMTRKIVEAREGDMTTLSHSQDKKLSLQIHPFLDIMVVCGVWSLNIHIRLDLRCVAASK